MTSAKQYTITPEHDEIIKEFKAGKNIFLTGLAGTGKSALECHLVEKSAKRGTYVTATTGTAAQLIKNTLHHISSTTLHKFVGAGLAEADAFTLVREIRLKEKVVSRWRNAKVLFVDESSMLDAESFEKFDKIARSLRQRPDELWGGIQLILVGDFFQLPPVNKKNADGQKQTKRMLFMSDLFKSDQIVKLKLREVFRQRDQRFVALLNNARYGSLSEEDVTLLKSLSRELPAEDGIKATKLYPTNDGVEEENNKRLNGPECFGQVRQFDAADVGQDMHLDFLRKNCMAAATIKLRVNAQVMYLINDTECDTLVNGTQGVVTGFELKTGLPVVKFANGLTKVIKKHKYEYIPDPHKKVVEASRTQLPLKLAWAISIHKAQGMTLSKVEVNIDKCFEFGQAYTALSRASNLEGLRVIMSHYDPAKFKVNPDVLEFDRALDVEMGVRMARRALEEAARQAAKKKRKNSGSSGGQAQKQLKITEQLSAASRVTDSSHHLNPPSEDADEEEAEAQFGEMN